MNNYNSEFFVKSMIEMRNLLKRQIIADFVENKETLQKLIDLGIDGAQGNTISPPTNNPTWRTLANLS
jgi:EAL domain-containing protein (putative c-di-GMP-specific phosphodiesterase class I)